MQSGKAAFFSNICVNRYIIAWFMCITNADTRCGRITNPPELNKHSRLCLFLIVSSAVLLCSQVI